MIKLPLPVMAALILVVAALVTVSVLPADNAIELAFIDEVVLAVGPFI